MDESGSIWNLLLSVVLAWPLTRAIAGRGGQGSSSGEEVVRLQGAMVGAMTNVFSELLCWIGWPVSLWVATGWLGPVLHWQTIAWSGRAIEGDRGSADGMARAISEAKREDTPEAVENGETV